ncbi:nuclear receptor coactivator 6 [Spea bombifrons]|uniref:nuclear receptor coactivator 6 n=1 Tax=Spea bombifrons TaxID=233779 RepID=UPI002349D108|nr:nuclear receptor coactivator 6 [Spea bombifrons]
MVSQHLSEPEEPHKLPSSNETELDGDNDSGIEDELRQEGKDSTIFLAFKGNIGDEDFKEKLTKILHNVPNLISMESSHLKVQKVEPWNSVRVTFNIPREAAERLRLLAQSNNQQLRDLGILSVQIEGEGAINLALSQNRGQEVRMNGPLGANNTMRMDAGFAMQSGTGLIRMNNPAAPMMSQGPHVSSAMMAASGSSEMQPRTPRPSQQDAMDPLTSGMTVQQQGHPSGSMAPQLHPMQTAVANRPINPANFQQFQQQARLPQHQQIAQGLRPSFATPAQVPVPPGWNQLASGALQPPPAQGAMGAVTLNQGWKKSPLSGGPMQQQQQFQQRPSLSTVQTPSHPPPPYPFGSQQASQAHANFSSISNPNQFNATPMKPLQGNPARAPTPLQQPHLTSKSPASSPSSFQQSSPASSPTVNQTQQQQQAMGPRGAPGSGMQQSFQQQPVSSPGRGGMMPQGTSPGNFMMQNQGPQGMHSGVPKRLPPGFPSAQGNVNFVAGQTPPSMAGSPVNGTALQQQGNGTGQGTGGQANGSSHNQMQGTNGGPNLMQTNMMALHNNLNNQQTSGSGVSQVNVSGLHAQGQQGPQSQLMGMHQQIISSQGQMVSLQGQAPLNTQGQLVLSRTPLMTQGQMMGTSQNQNIGQAPQRVTPPKPMIPSHNQLMTSQGQALMQQNPAVEQIIQGKQGFNTQNQAGVMSGPSSIIRGQAPNMTNNMVQFSGQAVSQQGSVSTNPPQGMNMQGQVLRQTVPGQHLQQPLGETANQAGGDLTSMMPDLSMQQTGNMAAQHMQNMPGNSGLGQHFAGHGLPFSSPFSQGGNGSQMACGQNPSFPVNKDVTLTSPLLVNLLQSDISAGHFGVNSKQNNANAAKPKKKKPPRKKKNPQGEEQMSSTEARMDDSDQTLIAGDQGGSLDGGQKLSEFANRPPGYPAQSLEQRQLQQIPPQLMQLGQQQGQGGQAQQPTPPQQMMMMLMMQQEQKPVRLPGQQGVFNPRPAMNSDAQRMPMQQGANMPVMVSLQGSGPVPPSPDKQRMPMAANVSLASSGRKMSFPESGQNQSGSPLGEGSSAASLPDVPEHPATPGPQSNMAPHLLLSQNQLMMAGSKPGASSSMSMVQGASPQQQQHSNAMPGSHGHHFQSVQTPSQTSRPKTPNRASPRPYYPQTPNNRPPSTEPSEISLSPERLNASIAGLFPPQINIPLPPRPTLNRGFDQQGLNPTTLKAIGQAPPGLTVNNQSSFGQHINKVDNGGTKQSNSGGSKRASPSNSRRSSPASSRKTTPSPGRQNSKAAKMVLGVQQNPGLLHSMEMQRNALAGQTSVQNPTLGSTIGQYPPVCMPTTSNPADDTRESPSVTQESSTQAMQMGGKEQGSLDINTVHQEKKLPSPEESARKDSQSMDASKAYAAEDNKTGISPAMRDAPTSLSQLLDHSNVSQSHHSGASQSQHSNGPSLTSKPTGQLNERSPHQMSTEDSKVADLPALSSDVFGTEVTGGPNPAPNTEPCTTQARPDALDVNSNVSMNLPASQLKRTGGPTSLSSSMPPNQITVFVTSNPITPSASVSAPMTSHLQQSLVPTVVNMPNMGNKAMVSEAQQSATSSARPQFITPVFFNSSSIIQVMKGSQGNMPQPAVAQNTNMMSQSVTVVGPLHISQNIQFPPGQPSSASPSNVTSSTSTTRPVHSNQMQTTSQLASSPSLLPTFPAHTQVKESGLEDANAQSSAPPDLCSPKSLQPTPPSVPDSSQCPSASGKRSSSAPSSDQCTLDKFSQLLLVKTGYKDGSAEDKLPTDLGSPHTVGTEAGNPVVPPSLASQPISEISHTPVLSLDPTCPANSPPADIMASPSDIHPALEGENGSRNVAFTEQAGICTEDNPTEQHPEKASQCASQEEAAVRDKESVPEKAEADPPETTESEPAERSRPPSRRNSKVDESPAPQETVEGGQRKRSARPSSASGSTKESGASPPQPKRRKSK